MSGTVDRSHRPVVCFLVLLSTLLGVVALTASWSPRWGVDVLAGTRVVVTPADPDADVADLRATAAELERRAQAAGAPGAEARVRSDGAVQVALPGRPDADVLAALRSTGEATLRLVLGGTPPPALPDDTAEPGSDGAGAGADDEPAPGTDPVDPPGLPGGVANDPPVEPAVPVCPDATAWPGASSLAGASMPELVCGPLGGTYVVGPVLLDGSEVTGAGAIVEDGTWAVDLDLDPAAAAALADVLDVVGAADDEAAAAREDGAERNGAEGNGAREGGTEDEADGAADEQADGTAEESAGPVGPARLALELDGEVALVAPLPPDRDLSDDGLLLLGGLDQPTTEALARRVADGALPAAVASVDVIELGSTLDPDEGTRGAVAALLAVLAALAAAASVLRRRALPLVAASVAAGALVVPLALLADQVAGLPLGLPVTVAAAVGWCVLPVLMWSAAARRPVPAERPAQHPAEHPAGRPGAEDPRAVVRASGRAAWRRWWPPVLGTAVGGGLVRLVEGGPVGDVGTMVATVLVACLAAGALVGLPVAVMTADAVRPRSARDPRAFGGRRAAAALLVALVVAGAAGLLVRGVAADPAFTAGEEHAAVVAVDPVDARASLRGAAREAGVVVSSVRASGPDTVLLTTPRLTDAERARLTAALAAQPDVRGPVASVGIEAAGSGRSWIVGGLLLAATTAVGVLLSGGRRRVVRRSLTASAGAAVAAGSGLGVGAWWGLTWSPATLVATATACGVAAVAAAALDERPLPTRLAPAALVLALVPSGAVALVAPSVRAPFVTGLAALAAGLCVAVVSGRAPAATGPSGTDVETDHEAGQVTATAGTP